MEAAIQNPREYAAGPFIVIVAEACFLLSFRRR